MFHFSGPLTLGNVSFLALCLHWRKFLRLDFSAATYGGLALGVLYLAWIYSIYGHKIEGKKPSFLERCPISDDWNQLGGSGIFIYKKWGILILILLGE